MLFDEFKTVLNIIRKRIKNVLKKSRIYTIFF